MIASNADPGDWMNLETKETAGYDWKKAIKDTTQDTSSGNNESGRDSGDTKNVKKITMYHT